MNVKPNKYYFAAISYISTIVYFMLSPQITPENKAISFGLLNLGIFAVVCLREAMQEAEREALRKREERKAPPSVNY